MIKFLVTCQCAETHSLRSTNWSNT